MDIGVFWFVLEFLKCYRFGKDIVGEWYKYKEKYCCYMFCFYFFFLKSLINREE